MTDPIVVPPLVSDVVRTALAERDARSGLPGMTRTAALVASELAVSPVTTPDVVRQVASWHQAHPDATQPDGRSTLLGGVWGGRAGRDWALSMVATMRGRWAEPRPLAVTAAASMSGAMICLYPDDPESLTVEGGDPADQLHVTLAFVAEDADALEAGPLEAVVRAAKLASNVRPDPLVLTVVGYGQLGSADPPASVLILQQDGSRAAQDGAGALADVVRRELNDFGSEGFPDEHDSVVPHLSVGYGVPVDQLAGFVGREVTFSAGVSLTLAGARIDYPWGEAGAIRAAIEPAGPVAAGIAVVAADTGRVLMLQRGLTDGDEHGGKWEWPGGKLDEGEGAYEAARREFAEEARIPVPGRLAGEWTSPDGVYEAFIHVVDHEADVTLNVDHEDRYVPNPDDSDGDCIEVVAWWAVDDADGNVVMRDEVKATTPWDDLRAVPARVGGLPATSTCEYCAAPATKALLHAEGMAYVPVCDAHEAKGKSEIGESELSGVRPFRGAISDPLQIIREIPGSKRRQRLKRASKRLQRVDTRLRAQLHAGAEVALGDGLRRAGVKVRQKAASRSKAAQAALAAADGRLTPSVLAAVGLTESEIVAHAFDAYREKADAWLHGAERERRRILADELDLTDDELAAADEGWTAGRGVAVGFLVGALTRLAYERLSDPDPRRDTEGEDADTDVPFSLIGAALAIADGRPTRGPGSDGPGPLGADEMTVDRFGDGITYSLVTKAEPGALASYTWVWGGADRPFEPHLELDGTTATAATMEEVWAKDEGFPDNGQPFYAPMDHKGCTCSWLESFDVPDATD